jgi:Flp pilus assembly protein TadD
MCRLPLKLSGKPAKANSLLLSLLMLSGWPAGRWVLAQPAGALATNAAPVVLAEIEGKVEFRAAGTTNWVPAKLNQSLQAGDALRTGERSRAGVRVGESIIRKSELAFIEVQPPPPRSRMPVLNVRSGLLYFFSRERPAELQIRLPQAAGAIRGTEFNLAVRPDGASVVTLIDGLVELSNAQGQVKLVSGEQGKVELGRAPTKSAVLASEKVNVIQWCLYYPAVLDLKELGLAAETEPALGASVGAYRSGDLLGALASYPAGRAPATPAESLYLAGLLLSVGQVDKAEALIAEAATRSPQSPIPDALRTLIAAVKFQPKPSTLNPQPSTASCLAESYYCQSQADLHGALKAARAAVEQSPDSGFGWERVAELEFSFGRIRQARAALDKSLQFCPRHAPALALKGFLHCAENQWAAAFAAFDQAIAIDGALGNAWLGRGLVRMRRGELALGREDLEMAAALEPHRALLRDYLAKAFSETKDFPRANKELELAKGLDARDPTAWLYSALLNRFQNRINEAVQDLEQSQDLNDNRNLFRSKLLLDQDQAVRSANLAAVYRDAGMTDVSVREASRAVNYDYANASAHLFLASSYDALRDPRQVNLRYETPWFNELLLANLLAPVGAGPLSQNVSQLEYSRLFERDRIGLSAGAEYNSRGDWQQYGSQFGAFGNFSYALDDVLIIQRGFRPNEDVDQLSFYAKFKYQLTPQDEFFLQTIYYRNESGDVHQTYDPLDFSGTLRFKETQEPDLFVGYHRAWAPGSHTLLLAARLQDEVQLSEPNAWLPVFQQNAAGQTTRVRWLDFGQEYRSCLEAYSTELQHILQLEAHTFIAGARFQIGQVDTFSKITRDPLKFPANLFNTANPADSFIAQQNSTDLERLSFYGYYHWQPVAPLRLIAGVSYDRLVFPANIDLPPISADQRTEDQVSPKAGLLWAVTKDTNLRASYTRSLGGLYYDTSVRLEPVQVAGFNQAFRSAIPESVAGLVPGSEFETCGVGLDHKFKTRTYLGVEGEILNSAGARKRGVFDFPSRPALPAVTQEELDYEEKTLAVTINQLVADEWAVGARYRLSDADLHDRWPAVAAAVYPAADTALAATLHQFSVFALFNHRSGCFAQAEGVWQTQSNRGYSPDLPGDDFWQFNVFAGYRFPRRAAELSMGLLNLSDQNYRLNPLNLHPELPRERSFVVRAKFSF